MIPLALLLLAAQDVKVEEDSRDEGQESFRIVTPAATYLYHRRGAGFSSLLDRDGRDWLGYRPKGGSDGKYRGIPNLVHPEGFFHPGGTACRSRIASREPDRVTIESESEDGAWACRWEIRPRTATLTVLRHAAPYWFLYEGTPGGKLEEDRDFCVRSDGTRTPLSEKWTGDLPSPEWVAFGDPKAGRVLFLLHHEDDDAVDSYWPMQKNMTVFGFGRHGLKKFLDRSPDRFTIGFLDATDPRTIGEAVSAVLEAAK